MSEQFKPSFYRIYSHRTRSRIIHFEDALTLDRIHLDAYEYARGQGTKAYVDFFIPRAEARLIFSDLITCSLATDSKGVYQELMSGTPRQGKLQARILKIGVTDARNPVYFEIMNCEGEQMGEGAVKPKAGTEQKRVRVLFDWRTARKIGLEILAHMNAWAASTYADRIRENTWSPESQPDPQPGAPDAAGDSQLDAKLAQVTRAAYKAGLNKATVDEILTAANGDATAAINGLQCEIVNRRSDPHALIPGKNYTRRALVEALHDKIALAQRSAVKVEIDPMWRWVWKPPQIIEFGQSLSPLIRQATSQA